MQTQLINGLEKRNRVLWTRMENSHKCEIFERHAQVFAEEWKLRLGGEQMQSRKSTGQRRKFASKGVFLTHNYQFIMAITNNETHSFTLYLSKRGVRETRIDTVWKIYAYFIFKV